MVNKENLNVRRIRISEKYISIFYDTMTRKVWLGTTNKVTQIDPLLLKQELHPKEVSITNIEINGNQEVSYSTRQSKHIRLNADQNNLTIFFSDYQYADESLMNYAYKLEGYHSQWMELNTGENSIKLSNLSPGDYTLYICPSEKASNEQLPDSILHITIVRPWYLSWYAHILYLFIASAVAWWVLRFIIIKQQLHKEREVKNYLMTQAKLKMEFFTNIAHELKTPLSLIIAPAGKLLNEEKNKGGRHRAGYLLPLATIPILLLTAKNDSNIEYQSAKLNIDAFMTKPFDCSLLTARIRQLLGNKERLEQQVRIEHIKQPELKGEISADERLLLRITTVIEEHIDDSDLSVDGLSRLIGISQKHLYRKIKSLTGMSTVEYIRSIRLKKAALLFHNGNFSVAEVMYMVGFSNASYFTRSFVAEFGKTPVDYLSDKQG